MSILSAMNTRANSQRCLINHWCGGIRLCRRWTSPPPSQPPPPSSSSSSKVAVNSYDLMTNAHAFIPCTRFSILGVLCVCQQTFIWDIRWISSATIDDGRTLFLSHCIAYLRWWRLSCHLIGQQSNWNRIARGTWWKIMSSDRAQRHLNKLLVRRFAQFKIRARTRTLNCNWQWAYIFFPLLILHCRLVTRASHDPVLIVGTNLTHTLSNDTDWELRPTPVSEKNL